MTGGLGSHDGWHLGRKPSDPSMDRRPGRDRDSLSLDWESHRDGRRDSVPVIMMATGPAWQYSNAQLE